MIDIVWIVPKGFVPMFEGLRKRGKLSLIGVG